MVVLIGWLVYSQGWLNKPVDNTTNNQILNNTTNNQVPLNNSTNPVTNNTVTNNTVKPVTPAIPTGWQTYTNNKYKFSVKYPVGWKVNFYQHPTLQQENVGFGPLNIQEDYQWGIVIYDSSDTTVDAVIRSMGSQWNDRAETRENILLNGINATKATITTAQVDGWQSVIIVFEYNSKIYSISNGAIVDPDYETFYKSFKFI